jgi:hypothetical protein
VSGFRCQVSANRNTEPETRIPNTETCIRTETSAPVICGLEFLFLQCFSTPKRFAIPTDKECNQPQSTIINRKFYRDWPQGPCFPGLKKGHFRRTAKKGHLRMETSWGHKRLSSVGSCPFVRNGQPRQSSQTRCNLYPYPRFDQDGTLCLPVAPKYFRPEQAARQTV